jgi:DsbC/DsbD-like thiol-disulfide interchange protein
MKIGSARSSGQGLLRPAFHAVSAGALVCACGGAATPPPETPAEVEAEPAPKQAEVTLPEEMPEQIVYAELKTSAQAIKPGGKFLLAVHFDMVGDYRISWTNPGDVGKTTQVSFEVPEGFEVGPVMFPAPKRFELPGKLVSYGYDGHTAVFAEVTAPKKLATNKAYRFDVKANWVACARECATENIEAFFELVATHDAPAPSLPADLAAHYAEIPQAFAELPTAAFEWKGTGSNPALTLSADKVKWIDFMLSDVERWKLVRVDSSDTGLNLRFEGSADAPMRGLAVAEVGGKHAYYDVNLPWPPAETKPQSRPTKRASNSR